MADRKDVRVEITATDRTGPAFRKAKEGIESFGKQASDSLETVAIGAGIATTAILAMANGAITAYADMERGFKSLDAVERSFLGTNGLLRVEAKALQDQFFGLNATTGALQRLISSGLGIEEATTLITAFKDRAILLGNASVPLEQRLINLAQAFMAEQSELGDSSGLTENFSKIVERGSEIIGKNTEEMTKSERALAKYKAIMELSQPFLGQAAELTETLTGQQASLSTELTKTQQAVGEAVAPAYQVLLGYLTQLTKGAREYASESPSTVMALTTITTGATVATTVVGGLTAAFVTLRGAMGPLGLVVTGISAAVGALAGLVVATEASRRKMSETRAETVDLMREYEALRGVLDDNTSSTDEKNRASEQLKSTLSQLFELQPHMKNWFDEEGRLLGEATAKWDTYRNAVVNARKIEVGQSVISGQRDLGKMRTERNNKEGDIRGIYEGDIQNAVGRLSLETDPERRRVFAENIRNMRNTLEDEITLAVNDIDAQIALKEAELQRDKALLDALNEPLKPEDVLPKPPPGAGPPPPPPGGSKPDPYRDALRVVQYKRDTEKIDVTTEIAMLEQVKAHHAKTAEEIMDIDTRLFRARQSLSDEDKANTEKNRKAKLDGALQFLDHQVKLGAVDTQNELLRLGEILTAYELTADERLALEERHHAVAGKLIADTLRSREEANAKTAQQDEDRVNHSLTLMRHESAMSRLTQEQYLAELQGHLQKEQVYYRAHADERRRLEEEIHNLQTSLAADAERREAERVDKAKQTSANALAAAEKNVMDAIRARHKVEQDELQKDIDLADERLRQLDQQYQAEDRLKKLRDAQQAVDDLERTGERQTVIVGFDATGKAITEERIVGMKEAQERLAEVGLEVERAAERERLQNDLDALREQMDNLREAHQEEITAHETLWQNLRTLAEEGYLTLQATQDNGITALIEDVTRRTPDMLAPWQGYVNGVNSLLDSIQSISPPDISTSGITTPTMPAAMATGGNSSTHVGDVKVEVKVDGQTAADPAALGRTVGNAVQNGVEAAIKIGRTQSRVQGRTRMI